MVSRYKRSSLLRTFINYGRKKAYNVGSRFQCHICKNKLRQQTALLMHLGRQHFKADLQKHYDPNVAKRCSLCSRLFSTGFELDSHLLNKHKVLESLIPPIDQLDLSGFSSVQGREREEEDHLCPLCQIQNQTLDDLLKHLAKKHFKTKLQGPML
jgi:C2H2-type zinc finger